MNPIPDLRVLLSHMPLAKQIRSALHISLLELPGLVFRKCVKRVRYWRMLHLRVRGSSSFHHDRGKLELPPTHWEQIIAHADAMLRDENTFFSFPYHLRGIERAWEFDPIEKKYWPRRHYTEAKLHASDTPRDVKIVWEINRFKDLPTLGQAYALTRDERYAEEALRRMVSWIDGNPFAATINWASALEIAIRLISWTTTISLIICHSERSSSPRSGDEPLDCAQGRLHRGIFGRIPRDSSTPQFSAPLRIASLGMTSLFQEGFEKVGRSIYEQARYLAADLSIDKVVPTNHLIGEAVGLFIVASFWKFPHCERYARRARRIIEREIVRQTFNDGITREASSWYHQFVTHFCDMADRTGEQTGNPFSERFRTRLASMKAFLETMTVDGNVIRYGDADDGWALWLEGNREEWINAVFGPPITMAAKPSIHYNHAHVIAAPLKNTFLFLRAGEFGMGGAGFSSHAHDDFLSPIIFLAGSPVLADPGTFVYNGNPKDRNRFRVAEAHNGLIIGNKTGAEPRPNFGWKRVRPDAKILEAAFTEREATLTAQYGEWPQHRRKIKVKQNLALIIDKFDRSDEPICTWHLHFAPGWKVVESDEGYYRFDDPTGHVLSVKLRGTFNKIELASYDFSPSYGVLVPAAMLRFSAFNPSGVYAILLNIESAL